LARETGARVVVLTPLPGGIAGIETYLDMLRHNILQLAQALEIAQSASPGPAWLYDNQAQPTAP
ncbi:MAG TPA: hypothetical protein VFL31_03665, partial [Nitrospiraceae bacterium]|nr:hypothetical protein [Nitrospiraceae bacterium]